MNLKLKCNVSLVGQWIDEAKSKLQDPGLVYSYHGSNRVRDASILAKSSIVVTTYATLCSDTFYHSNKAGGDYCAPCEKIRWWRIICDESHCKLEFLFIQIFICKSFHAIPRISNILYNIWNHSWSAFFYLWRSVIAISLTLLNFLLHIGWLGFRDPSTQKFKALIQIR